MNIKLFVILVCFLMLPLCCFPQQAWEEYVMQLAEESEEGDWENLYEDLTFLSQNKINLNAATKDDLSKLPFLTPIQLEKLETYLKYNTPMRSIYELRLIPDFDKETIDLILPFVYLGEKAVSPSDASLKNMLQSGKHTASIRFDKCLNEKVGYSEISAEELEQNPNKRYLGEAFYHAVRYGFQYRDKVQFGFAAEKDAGEMFWKERHKGYDFYSASLAMRNIKKINALVVGNYRLNFGQGLILNTDFSLGKSSQIMNIDKQNSRIKPHTSTSEYNYLQGVAGQIDFKNTKITLFCSNQKIDANVDEATHSILSVKKDGLHRTENELDKKNAAQLQTFGTRIYLETGKFSGAINGIYYSFDKPMNPESKPYNLFYFRGKDNVNVSFDYQYRSGNLNFFGETAISRNKAIAALAGLQLEAASYCNFSLLFRHYDKKYQAFFGNAFSESSGVQNETGIYLGLQMQPFGKWEIKGYADFFRLPWLKYGTDFSSRGFDGLLEASYTMNRDVRMFFRYRYKSKETNTASSFLDEDTHTYPLSETVSHRFRYQASYRLNPVFRAKSTADYTLYKTSGSTAFASGYLLAQEVVWNPKQINFETSAQLAYFNTDDYNSRIYLYERNVLYAFSIPSFYGEGIRSVFNFRYHLNKHISCWLRFSRTQYFDREQIGSGLEIIEGKSKNDISCLVRFKF